MKTVAIIPVKSHSLRIKSKNIRLLGSMPLFLHTLDKLINIDEIDEVWIDTDDVNIIKLANNYGYYDFKYFIRDKKYADNKTDGNLLLENEINNIESDIYVQVLCTSPFTRAESIIKSIELLKHKKYESVIGCHKSKCYLWKNDEPLYDKFNVPNSNTLDDTVIESMSLYAITKKEFTDSKLRIGTKPYLLELCGNETIDINYEKDFLFAHELALYYEHVKQQNYERLKIKLNSCILSDILHELKIENCILKNFNSNIAKSKMFGKVRPIQIRYLNDGENIDGIYDCLKSYESVNSGDIIFVNNLVKNKAYFGDLNATIALSKNAQGVIINGHTRDVDRLSELQFKTYYKNTTCDDVKGAGTLDYFDEPICVDDIKIHVNNLIFCDVDGVVIIPKNIEQKVLNMCIKVIQNEANISNSIICGENIDDIMNKFGSF